MTMMPERRKFIAGLIKGVGASALGGFVWAGFLEGKKAYPSVLRPPGAIEDKKFPAKCVKCGLCAEACPFRAIIIAKPGDERPVGTPYFEMRSNPCRMCRDIPCAYACPTGALDTTSVSRPDETGKMNPDINMAKIGLAVIDRETCIAYWGIQCDACYRACPLIDNALTVERTVNDRTGKHAILAPVVHSEHCTGCGMCERACVAKKASVFVLPRNMAMGESSDRYVRGWDEKDEERIGDVPEETKTVTPRSERPPLDYLNREGF